MWTQVYTGKKNVYFCFFAFSAQVNSAFQSLHRDHFNLSCDISASGDGERSEWGADSRSSTGTFPLTRSWSSETSPETSCWGGQHRKTMWQQVRQSQNVLLYASYLELTAILLVLIFSSVALAFSTTFLPTSTTCSMDNLRSMVSSWASADVRAMDAGS